MPGTFCEGGTGYKRRVNAEKEGQRAHDAAMMIRFGIQPQASLPQEGSVAANGGAVEEKVPPSKEP